MVSIFPCIWFDNTLEQAVAFYRGIFDSVELRDVVRAGPDGPGPEGSIVAAGFSIDGNFFEGINGGPKFPQTEAVSFVIRCKDQREVDYFWTGLTADGGKESMCGWLKDPFGVNWQIIPEALYQTVGGSEKAGAQRAMAAMLTMRKLIVADLEAAYRGD